MAKHRFSVILAVAAVALALIAAGCGGSSSNSAATTATTAPTGGTTQSGLSSFQACLKQHGVTSTFGRGRFGGTPPSGGANAAPPSGNRPAGGGQAPGVSSKQRQAFQACRAELPAGAGPRDAGQTPPGGGTNTAFGKYTQCLRKHGVVFGASNSSSATFRAATTACKSLLAAQGATSGGG
jgi:hypothetical protein